MSKKSSGPVKKKAILSDNTPISGNSTKHQTSPLQQSNIESQAPLIHWDSKTYGFVIGMLVLYAVCVLFKLHGSSSGMWNQVMSSEGISKKSGIVYGTAKSIRSDEWLGQVPFHVAQYFNGFHYQNETMGPLNTPLLWNMPNHFWVNVFRPSFWGSYFLDLEREFSYFWCYRIFITMISYFLFFMLVTKNNFILSVFGSLFGFLSAPNQWWSLYTGDTTAHICIIFVSLIYIIYSQDKKTIFFNAFILLLTTFGFAGHLYPAWQIPLVYFFIAIFIGYNIDNFDFNKIKTLLSYRIISISIMLSVLGVLLFSFYNEVKETAHIMMGTKYPGARLALGGNIHVHNMFTAFFGYFMSDGKLPTSWGNISEISKYLTFFPIPMFFIIRSLIVRQKVSAISISIAILILVNLIYVLVGFPPFLSIATAFKFTPGDRMLIPFGFICFVLTVIYIQEFKDKLKNVQLWEKGLISLVTIVFLFYVLSENLAETNGYFKKTQVTLIYLFAIITTISLIFVQYKWVSYLFMGLVLFFLLPNSYSINPINQGLPAFTKHPLIPILENVKKNDPDGKWVVLGNFIVPSYLKAFNLKVINGLTTMPDFKKMAVLDKGMKNDSVYNRYGYMNVVPYINNDSIIFQLNQPDLYTVALDPCTPRLKKLGVRYVVFTYQPQMAEIRCMDPIPNNVLPIYKLRD